MRVVSRGFTLEHQDKIPSSPVKLNQDFKSLDQDFND